tara:strand:+ start:82 stop:255 length:174 start_codon:yes stop_codon:yes gene_type:complete
MKNTLLILVLGLFAVGCLEDGPLTPAGHEFYECPTTNTVYSDEDACESYCDEECIED